MASAEQETDLISSVKWLSLYYEDEVAVAETVIVGGVPDNYTYFSTMPDEISQYAEDYIMNNG